MEDIIAITALGIFQSIAIEGIDESNQTASIIQIAISVAIVTAFIGITLTVGSRFIPNIIDRVGKTNDYALLLISILGLAFGLSFLASSLELSVATGAFLAGVLVAESKSGSNCKSSNSSIKGCICSTVLYFDRSTYGHITDSILNSPRLDSNRNHVCLKIVDNKRCVA